jgi:hypothetical protein
MDRIVKGLGTMPFDRDAWMRTPRFPDSYRCPFCGRRSHHLQDVQNVFCGACKVSLPDILDALDRGQAIADRIPGSNYVADPIRLAIEAILTADRTFNQRPESRQRAHPV